METLRNLMRRKLRNALTIAGIVIGVLALTAMGAIAEKFNKLVEDGERFVSDHLTVIDVSGNLFLGRSLIRTDKIDEILRVRGVAAAYPSVLLFAKADQGAAFGNADFIRAAPPAFFERLQSRLHVAKGRNLASDARGEVVLGSDIATEFRARVGDTIVLPVAPRRPRPISTPIRSASSASCTKRLPPRTVLPSSASLTASCC